MAIAIKFSQTWKAHDLYLVVFRFIMIVMCTVWFNSRAKFFFVDNVCQSLKLRAGESKINYLIESALKINVQSYIFNIDLI
jgi:hypothetical protein